MLAYPHLRFYVFTPIFSYKLDGDVAKNTDNTMVAGMYLKDVGDAIETACKALHIPCANMYYKSNINADNASYYSADGTHFNAKGYKLLGEKHAKVIQST